MAGPNGTAQPYGPTGQRYGTLEEAVQAAFGAGVVPGYGFNPPKEWGVDVALPQGAPVPAVEAGTFDAPRSSAYQAVIDVPGGIYESYTHLTVDPALYQGEQVAPGQTLGTVSGLTSANSPLTFQHGDRSTITYHSQGPHIEWGVYTDPGQAEFLGGNLAQTVDPLYRLNQLAAAGVIGASGTGGSEFIPGYNPQTWPGPTGATTRSGSTIPPPTQPEGSTVGSPTGTRDPFAGVGTAVHSWLLSVVGGSLPALRALGLIIGLIILVALWRIL